ncbi:MAG: lipoate--protein ligase [Bacteroidales bacterium]|nr:lipoate--protein ligase [Bacteroidales bacterium]
MLCIDNDCTNPYWNLAAEEYLLKAFRDDIFMLWRNEPSIIVGKHQNSLAEINARYVQENNIPVVRRLTGGGAVFHDLGNLNFTFISNAKSTDEKLIDFRKYTKPILDVMLALGIDARFEGRNDLTISGLKFSGNAEHIFNNRILHHGTLLFSTQLPNLSAALNVDPLKFTDKAVKSVRSRVTNISEHLKSDLDVVGFKNLVMKHINTQYTVSKSYSFNPMDLQEINNLTESKYMKWDWNFGESPQYNFRKIIKTSGGSIEFAIDVNKGIMSAVKIYGDFFNHLDISEIELKLQNIPHDPDIIRGVLSAFKIEQYFDRISVDELISAMF